MGNRNSIIFPVPKPSYELDQINLELQNDFFIKESVEDHIFFIDSWNIEKNNQIEKLKVPCFILPYKNENNKYSDKFLIYFHGNGEDIGYSYYFGDELRKNLHLNIILMEYPGYGIYSDLSPSTEQLSHDSIQLIKYLQTMTKVELKNIFLFGRSIGSGPATLVASQFENLGGLILMSAFSSIQDVAIEKKLIDMNQSDILKDIFPNKNNIEKVKCPVLLIHGKSDTLFKYEHSVQLENNLSKIGQKCMIYYPLQMSHNYFNMESDILQPTQQFLNQFANKENTLIDKFIEFGFEESKLFYEKLENSKLK